MAARRLVVVMLVLLAISTLAAALVPAPEPDPRPGERAEGGATRPREGRTGATDEQGSAGRLVQRRIRISNRRPPTIALRPGDQLKLLVSGPFGDDITIPAFGLTETMTVFAPARFDLIVEEAGTFPIRAVNAGRLVGRISADAPSRSKARPRARRGRPRPPASRPGGG